MKKKFTLVVGLLTLAAVSFAGTFGALGAYGVGPAYNPGKQLGQQLTFAEIIKALELTEDQAQKLLDLITEAKAQLSALKEEYASLIDKAEEMSISDFLTAKKGLSEKQKEIFETFGKGVADIITIGQIQNLKLYFFKNAQAFAPQYGKKGPQAQAQIPQMGYGKFYRGQRQQFGMNQLPPFGANRMAARQQMQAKQQFMAKSKNQFRMYGYGLKMLLDDSFEEALKAYLE